MKKYTARLAENDERDHIKNLADPEGASDFTWDDIKPWWTVVLDNDEIIACGMVVLSRPIGFVESFCYNSRLKPTQKAYAFKTFSNYALFLLRGAEIKHARCSIEFGNKTMAKAFKRHYGEHMFNAGIYSVGDL